VLDAVGVGATPLRDDKAFEILDRIKVGVIKGNASEIAKLAGVDAVTRGVEATEVGADLLDTAQRLSGLRRATVVITGGEDIVSGGGTSYIVRNGHSLMGAVVGTGCMAASVIGAFAGVDEDLTRSAACALACYGVAGELAAVDAKGPGSFKEALFDAVFNLDGDTAERMARIETR